MPAEDGWVVLDYSDCVLHVFTTEARERYQLEELWHEAPRTVKRPRRTGSALGRQRLISLTRARPYGAAPWVALSGLLAAPPPE